MGSGQGQLVVVLDDDADLLCALTFAFETDGLAVAAFHDAESMLAADTGGCACFVLDFRLPGMSGLDLLDALRAKGATAPAILITSNPAPVTRARARACGALLVEKPLDGDVLRREVRRLLRAEL